MFSLHVCVQTLVFHGYLIGIGFEAIRTRRQSKARRLSVVADQSSPQQTLEELLTDVKRLLQPLCESLSLTAQSDAEFINTAAGAQTPAALYAEEQSGLQSC